ncbi:MAG: HIT domain-containing protein [Parachlamydiaceae bacterium]
MSIKQFKVEKLIRDKLPGILESKGIKLEYRNLGSDEFIHQLKEKLLEEAAEVKEAKNDEELLEELADVLDVAQTLSSMIGSTIQHVEEKRLKKRQLKGGFDDRVYCKQIEMGEDHPAITYYINKPKQYPEIKQSHLDNCLFCQMAQGQKSVNYVAKFKHCYAVEDPFPVSPGHLLFIPYQHTDDWFAANEEIREDIMRALEAVKKQIDIKYQPQGYHIGMNCGRVVGQTIVHLYVQLIPRYQDDMEDPKGGVRSVIPSQQSYDPS